MDFPIYQLQAMRTAKPMKPEADMMHETFGAERHWISEMTARLHASGDIVLPELPGQRPLAFDDGVEIRGYNACDISEFAILAVRLDRIRRAGVFGRILFAIRGRA